MRIGEAGHQVEPVPIDDFGSLWDFQLSLRLDFIDPIAHDDDCLAGYCDSVFNVNNRHIRDRIDTR